jgi:hypothetical protein
MCHLLCLRGEERQSADINLKVPAILEEARGNVPAVKSAIAKLAELIPPYQFYRSITYLSFLLRLFYISDPRSLPGSTFFLAGHYKMHLSPLYLWAGWNTASLWRLTTCLSNWEVRGLCFVAAETEFHSLIEFYFILFIGTVKEYGSDNRFQLKTEDYLHSLVTLTSELVVFSSPIINIQKTNPNRILVQSRLSLNSITHSSYQLPLRISSFCKEIAGGFALLNLKNDSLRRRADSIKVRGAVSKIPLSLPLFRLLFDSLYTLTWSSQYDIKRIEEVVYDISLRKLV